MPRSHACFWTGTPRVCLRSVRKQSRRANLKCSIPMPRSTRFLPFRAAHANARGSFRGHDPKELCIRKKPVDALWKSVRCSIQKLTNHPQYPTTKTKKRRKEKPMHALLLLFAFTYFVVLPVSLTYIVEWIIHRLAPVLVNQRRP